MQGHVDVIRILLKHGADVTIQDSDGMTALHKVGNRHESIGLSVITAVIVRDFNLTFRNI